MAVGFINAARLGCPYDGVFNYALDVFVVEGREGFMTGTEIENASVSAREGHAAAEHFAAGEPAGEDQFVGLCNVKMLAIGLLMLQFLIFGQTGSDRMRGSRDPKAFLVAAFAPF